MRPEGFPGLLETHLRDAVADFVFSCGEVEWAIDPFVDDVSLQVRRRLPGAAEGRKRGERESREFLFPLERFV